MKKLLSSVALGLAWLGTGGLQAAPTLPDIPGNSFNVAEPPFNAKGDGATDNTASISNAIAAISAVGGGTVEIPGPGNYLCGPLILQSRINLQVDTGATLKMLPYGTYPNLASWIAGTNLSDDEISGSGTIDGQGAAWWAAYIANLPNGIPRPDFIQFANCNRILVRDITLQNPPTFHLMLKNNDANITVSNITINTPGNSPNTDGFDLAATNILIENSSISDGDDNVEIGGSQFCADLLITNCAFGTGHGVSVGSITSGGVSNVVVVNCTFNNTDYGIRLKSDNKSSGGGAGGLVQNLSYSNLSMTNITYGAIVIYSYYEEFGTPIGITPTEASTQAVDAVTPNTVLWTNITFTNITASVGSNGIAGIIWGRIEQPAEYIILDNVNITAPAGFDLYNIGGFLINPQINPASGPDFLIYNADTFFGFATNLVSLDGIPGNLNEFDLLDIQAGMADSALLGANLIGLQDSLLFVTNNLVLAATNQISFILDTNAATINVSSNLTLNGTLLNFFAGPGFNPKTNYLIFTYNGTLSGTPTIGWLPVGFVGNLITNIPDEVFLGSKPVPVFTNITFKPNTLMFSGTNGTPGSNYIVMASTNLLLPRTNWTPQLTQQFNAFGNFSFTLTPGTNGPHKFYLLKLP
jgi:hypothetical protein